MVLCHAIQRYLQSLAGGLFCGWRIRLRNNLHTFSYLLSSFGDYAVAGLQTFLDNPQGTNLFARLDLAKSDFPLVIDHCHHVASLQLG